jgi:type II secretory pathway pseudopilin PulG
LLELIIVLMVMVGLLAVAWPNLRRPLERTTAREAAQGVRDAIEESLHQAATEGQIRFVRLRPGESLLWTGTFDEFLATEEFGLDELGGNASFRSQRDQVSPQATSRESSNRDTNAASDPGRPRQPREWQLPTEVKVLDVQWTSTPVLDVPSQTASPLSGATRSAAGNDSLPRAAAGDASDGAFAQAADELGVEVTADHPGWWLPISPVSEGRDASVLLIDVRTRNCFSVRYESATGAIEIVRE